MLRNLKQNTSILSCQYILYSEIKSIILLNKISVYSLSVRSSQYFIVVTFGFVVFINVIVVTWGVTYSLTYLKLFRLLWLYHTSVTTHQECITLFCIDLLCSDLLCLLTLCTDHGAQIVWFRSPTEVCSLSLLTCVSLQPHRRQFHRWL